MAVVELVRFEYLVRRRHPDARVTGGRIITTRDWDSTGSTRFLSSITSWVTGHDGGRIGTASIHVERRTHIPLRVTSRRKILGRRF